MKQTPQLMKLSMTDWLPDAIRQDPKKAGVLGVLVLVLGVVVVRWLATSGPASAAAQLRPPPAASLTNVKTDAGAGGSSLLASGATRGWLKSPVRDVSRDLFAVRHEFFPQVSRTSANAASASVVKEQKTFWDAIQKSRDQAADQKRRRDILVDNLQREAAKLRLQSTVMGPEPQAIIGGSLVKEGDSVSASADTAGGGIRFRVLRIEARRVIIEREGIKLEVRMAQ